MTAALVAIGPQTPGWREASTTEAGAGGPHASMFDPGAHLPWEERARCRPELMGDPDVMVSEGGYLQIAAAQMLCKKQCPVRLECLAYGFEINDMWMIYGGLTSKERRAIRLKHPRSGAGELVAKVLQVEAAALRAKLTEQQPLPGLEDQVVEPSPAPEPISA